MRFDPLTIRLFVALMEDPAIARVATKFHMAQSAASRRVADLESHLEVSLFNRTNRGLHPTEAAERLLSYARRILHEIDEMVLDMKDFGSGSRGLVRLAVNASSLNVELSRLLHRFMQQYQQVHIQMQQQLSIDVARSVAENAADIGITTDGSYSAELVRIPYREDNLVLIVPAGHALSRRKKIAFRDALAYDIVSMHPGSFNHHQLMQESARAGCQPNVRMLVSSYEAMCLMVAAGNGLGFLPSKVAALYAQAMKIRLVSLDDAFTRSKYVICIRDRDGLSSAAKRLVEFLESSAPVELS